MLYVIGLGLGDEKDITLRGLEAIEKCSRVYMEAYTSLLSFGLTSNGLSTLEKVYGNQIIIADREMVEEKADDMLSDAQVSDVAILVVGDPFGATTHSDLVVRAKKLGVDVKVVHNASVMNAIGVCGLQLYRYGETVSIPFFTDTWRPDSFYEKIKRNRSLGSHTHWLLDIRVKERTLESLCRGKKVYEPPRFMTTNTAIEQLLEVEQNKCPFSPLVETFLLSEAIWKNCHFKDKQLIPLYSEDSTCVGLARVMKQLVTIEEMLEFYPTDGNSTET